MHQGTSNSEFECIALVPSGPRRPYMALAAVRGGGIGILNLEFAGTGDKLPARLLDQVHWLCDRSHPGDRIGVRLSSRHLSAYAACLAALDPQRTVVILTEPPDADALATARGEAGGRRVLAEVRTLQEYQSIAGGKAVPDGVIACGHETGGLVGEDSTFILLQKLLQHSDIAVYARGGIGLRSAAGCRAAGARGVVLDDQLLLTPQSPLPDDWKQQLAGVTGYETVILGQENGVACRVFDRPAFTGLAEFKAIAHALAGQAEAGAAEWAAAVEAHVGWGAPAVSVWPVGQAIGLAANLQARFHGTEGIVRAIIRAGIEGVELAREYRHLAAGAPLAYSHGTEYPIVQGPMTRVSDRPEFARAVAEGGALPLIALAMLSGSQIRPVLEATRDHLGERPWGVGILGFVAPALREEQLAEVRRVRPPFAVIAGGRPDLASSLEALGIATYLHVPVPSLLRSFLTQGSRRFIFEGRECGGHVGPLCSFPLWEAMIEVLLDTVAPSWASSVHVLFAGGIHDALSGAMVAAMTAPLAERGIKCGVLMGTAYLFTHEAVDTGAIVGQYQKEAMDCAATVLLTSAAGHSTRVASTAFAEEFERERRVLLQAGTPPNQVQAGLENMMLGRLRLASKGVTRDGQGQLIRVGSSEQSASGVYMLGQVATLRSSVHSIAELHRDVSEQSTLLIVEAANRQPFNPQPEGVAIVGIACLLPGAATPTRFWRNILDRVNAIGEVPPDRWDIRFSYNPEKSTRDKSYSRWGGFIDDVSFDPIRYRIPPATMPSISTTQLLALEATYRALADAGYGGDNFDRDNTAVVLGTNGGGSLLNEQLIVRALLPHLFGEASEGVLSKLPEWTGESFPGVLANVAAGRIANQFDLGGPNYAVDAACASSLVALDLAVRELESGRSNLVVTGGVDTSQTPFSYVAFSKTQALSPSGRLRVFDKSADGTVISEGVCILVLKRLADAHRDRDRVYAVVRGTGGSSDGKGLGLTAPKVAGQRRAVERALHRAGVDADTIGLYEAHGTGTPLGDRTELETLLRLLSEANAAPHSCNVGSVKSLVGHTKMAAGAVGVAKAALALYHRVLPPQGGIDQAIDPLIDAASPLYTVERPQPWLANRRHPRRAGVSAFGFGGTNSHVVLEESGEPCGAPPGAGEWPCELFLFSAPTENELGLRLAALRNAIAQGCEPPLADLAFAMAQEAEHAPPGPRLAMVAADLTELAEALAAGEKRLRGDAVADPSPPVMFSPTGTADRIAFLFPGQGSQYLNMGWEPTLYFDELRTGFEFADAALSGCDEQALSHYIFVPTAFDPACEGRQKQAINQTARAQPAIGAFSVGLLDLLERLGVRPDLLAGHSYGELTALHAAGMISRQALFRLSEARGRAMGQCCGNGGMASVSASREQVADIIGKLPDVVIANHNGPFQTVISGASEALQAALVKLAEAGLSATALPVAGAFHSPLMAPALESWGVALEGASLREPQRPVYGNSDGTPYSGDLEAARRRLREHVLNPVEFVAQITRMYADGARIFIEVGPGRVLARLVASILKDLPHECVALDARQGQLRGLLSGIGALAVQGVVPWPTRLFEGRCVSALPLERLLEESKAANPSATAWRVNGTHARPLSGAGPLPMEPSVQEHAQPATEPKPAASGVSVHAWPVDAWAVANPASQRAFGSADPADILAAYSAYQETMRRFLALEEQALGSFMALAQGGDAKYLAQPAWVGGKPSDAGSDRVFGPAGFTDSLAQGGMERGSTAPTTASAASSPAQSALPAEPAPALIAETVKHPANAEDLQGIVLQVLGKQTGYPIETLGLDLDLAGDLGIDSLRKVEFFTALTETLPTTGQAAITGAMDEIMAASTIRILLGRLRELLQQPSKQHGAATETGSAVPAADNTGKAPVEALPARIKEVGAPKEKLDCPRFLPMGYPLALEKSRSNPLRGTVLITEDGVGVAQLIAEKLHRLGMASVLVPHGTLKDAQALQQCLRDGPDDLGALLHLAPIAHDPFPERFEEWHSLVQVQAKSLFHILHSGWQRLRPKQDAPPLHIIAASLMGGQFGRNGSVGPGLPIGGAGTGILKSLALEWPGTVVKAIDLDGTQSPGQMADTLLDELLYAGAHREIGYPGGVRTVFTSVAASHRHGALPAAAMPSGDWVVLATGGARGITADVLRRLARPGMTIILSGRAAAPVGPEPAELSGLGDASALRAYFIDRSARTGDGMTPVLINKCVQEVMHDRERRATLTELGEAGVNVIYRNCDMRTPSEVGSLLEWIYASHGRLDGLIHGAGIIEDKLLVDKDWVSFDRVFDTKVDSAYLLSRFIRPETLKLAVFFGSVSGRVGNPGQTDYAAANEVLNRFSWWLRQHWPKARVVTINWGPWATSGMATQLVQAQLKKRGIHPIEVDAGRDFFADEIALGAIDDVEVLAGAGPWAEPQSVSREGASQWQRPSGKAI